jgi:hypothetical protein
MNKTTRKTAPASPFLSSGWFCRGFNDERLVNSRALSSSSLGADDECVNVLSAHSLSPQEELILQQLLQSRYWAGKNGAANSSRAADTGSRLLSNVSIPDSWNLDGVEVGQACDGLDLAGKSTRGAVMAFRVLELPPLPTLTTSLPLPTVSQTAELIPSVLSML